ncbi:hypothetical protein [Streptomyces erythrochromogenes]|uniref:hypothetical protein n=1 Tax=Streptomyces erythrochromogenes TaxID=285574 RepID=UPI003685164B
MSLNGVAHSLSEDVVVVPVHVSGQHCCGADSLAPRLGPGRMDLQVVGIPFGDRPTRTRLRDGFNVYWFCGRAAPQVKQFVLRKAEYTRQRRHGTRRR